ncbi:hypothetical protein IMSAGC011_03495 [Lachnospiraceae bacterium]|nr:hypothetical protein IMSAGC011_03495 [Lachnospiraceae bacterium]
MKYKDFFGGGACEAVAHHFQKSGKIIEKIVDGFIEDVMNCSFGQPEKYIPLFQALRGCEEEAFCKILYTQN